MKKSDLKLALVWIIQEGYDWGTVAEHFDMTRDELKAEIRKAYPM